MLIINTIYPFPGKASENSILNVNFPTKVSIELF